MNTQSIYNAQLNVSKFFTTENINNLIDMISNFFKEDNVYYNIETKTIDIETNRPSNIEDDENIRNIIAEWITSFSISKEDKDIIIENLAFILNICRIGYSGVSKHIIKISLY